MTTTGAEGGEVVEVDAGGVGFSSSWLPDAWVGVDAWGVT